MTLAGISFGLPVVSSIFRTFLFGLVERRPDPQSQIYTTLADSRANDSETGEGGEVNAQTARMLGLNPPRQLFAVA
jgi:hypothetical protein